uniref:Uncharacterized protein n=1 Tax=Zea mays TaxID=4577 RepID=A0A804R378_MAIZE
MFDVLRIPSTTPSTIGAKSVKSSSGTMEPKYMTFSYFTSGCHPINIFSAILQWKGLLLCVIGAIPLVQPMK